MIAHGWDRLTDPTQGREVAILRERACQSTVESSSSSINGGIAQSPSDSKLKSGNLFLFCQRQAPYLTAAMARSLLQCGIVIKTKLKGLQCRVR